MSGRPPPPPRVDRDGFAAVSDAQVVWDDRTASLGLQDVRYAVAAEGIAKITISRPQVHNSFRPITVDELVRTLTIARNDVKVGVIILTGDGPHAFCAGGDQAVRGDGGYDDGSEAAPRLQILDFQVQMRRCPKPIIAMVAGYAVGGGHILHMVADLTIAADNAVFGQDRSVRRRPLGSARARPLRLPRGAPAISVRLGTPTGRLRVTGCHWVTRRPATASGARAREPAASKATSTHHLHPPPPPTTSSSQHRLPLATAQARRGRGSAASTEGTEAHTWRASSGRRRRASSRSCRLCIQPAALCAQAAALCLGCSPVPRLRVPNLQPCVPMLQPHASPGARDLVPLQVLRRARGVGDGPHQCRRAAACPQSKLAAHRASSPPLAGALRPRGTTPQEH